MYAVVVPVIRSIRGKDKFTYHIPSTIQLIIGELVTIPWKNHTLTGVVWAFTEEVPVFKTKNIIISLDIHLDEMYLRYIEWFAHYYYISLSYAFKLALPEFPKRKVTKKSLPVQNQPALTLPKTHIQAIQNIVRSYSRNNKNQVNTILYVDRKDVLACIQGWVQNISGVVVVLVPEEDDAQWLCIHLEKYHPRIVTSSTTTQDLYNTWQDMTAGISGLYIGTKRLSLFPIHVAKKLIILNPEHPTHKQWDQNPRYHVFTLAKQSAEMTKQSLIAFSEVPRVDQYSDKTIDTRLLQYIDEPSITMVEMQPGDIIAEPIMRQCENSGATFLWLNNKGLGKFLLCRNCHCLISNINTVQCPQCESVDLYVGGRGTAAVRSWLLKHLPHRLIIECTKDTPPKTIPYEVSPIIIGTTFAHRYIDWAKINYIAALGVDYLLAQPDFRAHEKVLYELVRLRNYHQSLTLQTFVPNHAVFQALARLWPEHWYRTELEQRKLLQLPPYGEHIQIRHPKMHTEKIITSLKSIPSDPFWLVDRE